MSLTLTKGQNLSLAKEDPSLTTALVGLGWDVRSTDGAEFDLDASALLVNAAYKVRSDADFVFYNQMGDITIDGKNFDEGRASVKHLGDNRTGEGDGDDEQVIVHLNRVPQDVEAIQFAVSIHDGTARGQNFGQVRNAFIRLENPDTGKEILRYDLTEDYFNETSLIFAELYRDKNNRNEWKFKAIGQGYADGLGGIAREFGVSI